MEEDISAAWLFGFVLPRALSSDPVALGQLAISHLDRMCEWAGFPEPYAGSIRAALEQRADKGPWRRVTRFLFG